MENITRRDIVISFFRTGRGIQVWQEGTETKGWGWQRQCGKEDHEGNVRKGMLPGTCGDLGKGAAHERPGRHAVEGMGSKHMSRFHAGHHLAIGRKSAPKPHWHVHGQ
jgi:hypothetical protein